MRRSTTYWCKRSITLNRLKITTVKATLAELTQASPHDMALGHRVKLFWTSSKKWAIAATGQLTFSERQRELSLAFCTFLTPAVLCQSLTHAHVPSVLGRRADRKVLLVWGIKTVLTDSAFTLKVPPGDCPKGSSELDEAFLLPKLMLWLPWSQQLPLPRGSIRLKLTGGLPASTALMKQVSLFNPCLWERASAQHQREPLYFHL